MVTFVIVSVLVFLLFGWAIMRRLFIWIIWVVIRRLPLFAAIVGLYVYCSWSNRVAFFKCADACVLLDAFLRVSVRAAFVNMF